MAAQAGSRQRSSFDRALRTASTAAKFNGFDEMVIEARGPRPHTVGLLAVGAQSTERISAPEIPPPAMNAVASCSIPSTRLSSMRCHQLWRERHAIGDWASSTAAAGSNDYRKSLGSRRRCQPWFRAQAELRHLDVAAFSGSADLQVRVPLRRVRCRGRAAHPDLAPHVRAAGK